MNREKLFKNLEKRYTSKRDMISRIPLGVNPDSLWQELLNLRRSSSTVLPLYSCNGNRMTQTIPTRSTSLSTRLQHPNFPQGIVASEWSCINA